MEGEHDSATAAPTSKLQYLGRLAAEIHIEIAKILEKEDLRSLRRVSRSLGKDTFDVFAAKNFSNLSCRFTTRSLENVRNISTTPHFVKHVKTIAFDAGSGYKPELSWPLHATDIEFVDIGFPEYMEVHHVVEVRAPEANDVLLGDIFSNFARCGSAKRIALNTTEEFFIPALHTVAIALTTSGHVVEELHCSIEKHIPHVWDSPAWECYKKLDCAAAAEFPRVSRDVWSKLRAIQVRHPGRGNYLEYVGPALCSLIRAAYSVQELTLQVPSGQFWWHIGWKLTDRHNLRTLKVLGSKCERAFDNWQLRTILSNTAHSLETFILEDIELSLGYDMNSVEVKLERLWNSLDLSRFSCCDLRTTESPFVGSHLLLEKATFNLR
ncbi:hypothetical protein CKM354_000917800 [Cercospora kikuchii]|uniref:F-box domain-containing protein n=1 Tax=Cercospora kikuchii TaxID=84275 RepID=A0A9P3FG32_9PEZI|nr:uncharacterized protein CKM354_000917800 [Cercospora kikuchii]GIZ46036.1 hypothetical protein CKM354_000917800 [Cercospora kikuchii]